jgi:hypothetical protein
MRKTMLPLAAMAMMVAGLPLATPAMAQDNAAGQPLQQAELAPVRDVLTAVQQKLQQLGYDEQPSGHFNAQTRNNVLRFQSEHGLRPTGAIDLSTIAKLGIDIEPTGQTTASIQREPGQQYAMAEPSSTSTTVVQTLPPPRYIQLGETPSVQRGNAVGESRFINPHVPMLRFDEHAQAPQISDRFQMDNAVGLSQSPRQFQDRDVGALPAGVFLDTSTNQVWD